MNIPERVAQLSELYVSLDRATSSFVTTTRIGCKSGCGACCMKPDAVWASVGEMLPLAVKLFSEGRGEDFFEKLNSSDSSWCAMFEVKDRAAQMGRCSEYASRPTICRLFGASARLGKQGQKEILACGWQRAQYQTEIKSFSDQPHSYLSAESPLAHEWASRVKAVFPEAYLQEELPINQALKESLAIVLQAASYE